MIGALVLALALGAAAGWLAAPGGSSSQPPIPAAPGPTRLGAGGVGVGYAHSRAGAIAANAHYQQAFAEAAILRPGQLKKRVDAVATATFAPRMLAANRPGARRLAAGAFGAGYREGTPSLFFGVPVAYRVLRYSPQRALIASWGFTVLGNGSTAEPTAYFGGSEVELRWSEGDWKVAHSRASFGPTPRLGTPRAGAEGFELVDVLEGMERYAVTP